MDGGLKMAYRFTNTDKWADSWYSNLKPNEKLLFNYICDNCDIAGFIEVNYKRWAIDIGLTIKEIEISCIGLSHGFIFSNNSDCIYVRNFLKHQKNLPLNENNKAHQGILKRFNIYAYKFDIQDIELFIQRGLQGACKGLASPTGNGNGNGNGSGNGSGVKKTNNPSKNKNEFVPPSMEDVISYFKENGYSEQSAKKSFEYYNTNNWRDSRNNPVKNWKQKMIAVWFKDENKDKPANLFTQPQQNRSHVSASSYGPDFDPTKERF